MRTPAVTPESAALAIANQTFICTARSRSPWRGGWRWRRKGLGEGSLRGSCPGKCDPRGGLLNSTRAGQNTARVSGGRVLQTGRTPCRGRLLRDPGAFEARGAPWIRRHHVSQPRADRDHGPLLRDGGLLHCRHERWCVCHLFAKPRPAASTTPPRQASALDRPGWPVDCGLWSAVVFLLMLLFHAAHVCGPPTYVPRFFSSKDGFAV